MIKSLGLSALAAAALALIVAGTASATTFEVEGITKNEKSELTASLKPATGSTWRFTNGEEINTCTESTLVFATGSTHTGPTVTTPISSWSFAGCPGKATELTKAGQLYIERIPGTTNGTVFLENTEANIGWWGGGILPCKPPSGTDIGTLTGVTSGHATLHIAVALNCSWFWPSVVWNATYVITSPTGLGVSP